MLRPWKSHLRVAPTETRVLITDSMQGDLLKGRLPMDPRHPRALLTLLEGMALWQGHPLHVVLFADEACRRGIGSGLFGDELWPAESPLVRFEVALRGRRKRLEGLGDFRALRTESQGEWP